jgi:homospermidine synthase
MEMASQEQVESAAAALMQISHGETNLFLSTVSNPWLFLLELFEHLTTGRRSQCFREHRRRRRNEVPLPPGCSSQEQQDKPHGGAHSPHVTTAL